MHLPFQKEKKKTLYGEGIQTGKIDVFFYIDSSYFLLACNQFIFRKEEVVGTNV